MDHGKTRVRTVCDDNPNGDWKKNDEGYIRGCNDIPYVAHVLGHRVGLMLTHQLEVIKVDCEVD